MTSNTQGNVIRLARCPICRRPRDARYRPFCSKRCRDVDLSRWFNQVYAVPALDPGDVADEADEER